MSAPSPMGWPSRQQWPTSTVQQRRQAHLPGLRTQPSARSSMRRTRRPSTRRGPSGSPVSGHPPHPFSVAPGPPPWKGRLPRPSLARGLGTCASQLDLHAALRADILEHGITNGTRGRRYADPAVAAANEVGGVGGRSWRRPRCGWPGCGPRRGPAIGPGLRPRRPFARSRSGPPTGRWCRRNGFFETSFRRCRGTRPCCFSFPGCPWTPSPSAVDAPTAWPASRRMQARRGAPAANAGILGPMSLLRRCPAAIA